MPDSANHMSSTVKLSVQLHLELTDPLSVIDAAQRFENLGADSVFVWDHLKPHFNASIGSHLECWTMLGMIATNTRTVQFGPLVSCVPWRNPNLIVAMSETLNEASGGRLRLGLGAGWNRDEFLEFGFDFQSLNQRLTEFETSIEIITKSLSASTPKRSIPIIVGGRSPELLRIAAKDADEWNWFGWDLDNPVTEFKRLNGVVTSNLRELSRDPVTLKRSVVVTELQSAYAEALVESGAHHIVLTLPHPFGEETFMRLSERLRL